VNKRLNKESIARQAALLIPPTIEVSNQWTQVLWVIENNPTNAKAMLAGKLLYILAEGWLKAPL
jgi:hypothetical protein